jgi:NAD(P)-dependent dehydrogenase (short-subunit alcohol dehydrogenase family)
MRHVWITGAGRGIGAAIALAFAKEGAHLSLSGRNHSALGAQKKLLEQASPNVKVHLSVMDLADADAVLAAHKSNHEAFGPVDVLINNAGQAVSQPFAKTDMALWQQMLSVNLTGTYLCIQAALPDLLSAGAQGKAARIVNIASTAGLKGYAYVAAYAAAKHGVMGLTRSLALELARKGVTVNAVCPGFTETSMVLESIANIVAKTGQSEAQAREALVTHNPQKKMIQPEEVAQCVMWLCSEAATSVNGQAIAIDGGETVS